MSLKDYRPISLIGCVYKIVANLLARRLKYVVGKVVSPEQSAYIEGRQILDGPLMLNEVCNWAKRSKNRTLLFKVDFDKAFDSLSWGFIDSILEQMQFGNKWRSWIHGRLSSARASVLVNGAPYMEFPLSRGVRQGDPLSSFLFIIVMEGLHIAMAEAISTGHFQGVSLPNNGPSLSHFYSLMMLLRCFHLASGLRVNFSKSKVFGIGVHDEDVQKLSTFLRCDRSKLPFTYLGITVGANMNLARNWQPIIDKDFAEYFKFMADESDVMSILSFSTSPEFTADLRVKYCHEVVKSIEKQVGFYRKCGKYLIMKEIYSLKLENGQSVKDHLLEMRKLFKSLSRMGYKMVQEELVHLMCFSLTDEIRTTVSGYIGEPKRDVAKLHEDILASLEPKLAAVAELMDTDWIDELGDLSFPEYGSKDICAHSMDIDQLDIGLPDAPGIFMIDCLITSYESWVLDTGCGNHICNHLQGFNRRETLRKDCSNLRVGEGTMLVAEVVDSYSLSLPSGLVLELENCYYVPKMIKNVISFDLLVYQGFCYKYDYKLISCFKNDVFYFKATPSNGLYVLNLQENKEVYHISKRSKEIEDQTYLWHCRLGHINKKRIEKLQKGGLLGSFNFRPFDNCESCLSGKMTKQPFNKDNERANELLGIIHTDVCGPFSHEARGGYRYFITFTDDFSRYGYVYLIRHKSEAFKRFKEFQNEVQNQLDRKIKFLRSDRGGEYQSQEFDNHLMECRIFSQLTPPYTPQMNGVSERRNRTLLDMVRSMMCRSSLPVSFWGHALETAAHILNRVPTKSEEKTPYKIWMSKKPKMSFLKIWGCEVYVKRPTCEKLKPKSDKCFFVGYPKTTVGYYFYNPTENKVFVARNGEFLEDKFLNTENTTNDDLRRSTRIRQEPDRYLGFLVSQDDGDLNEPTSYGDAVSGSESQQWQEAMKAEMQSMYGNQVWELTDLPQHCRAVGRKWVFKKKTDMDGNVHTFKARLVAKAYFNYEIWQMDVKTAFLNGKLTEDVYMQQSEGFVDPKNPDKVCKLLKSICGLKQASRSWNLHFDERIKEFGFAKSEFEPCVYTNFSGSVVTFLVLYVDDILLIGNDVPVGFLWVS
ncbi:hypothetical protein OSB04_019659 [Centaurea solstitialis]|uniref:Uncharacterized protein n=1 Tax=Centaurea solstitialis TaxID=347529 RepID=A0AA38WG41_9ASTR|nr:hypothetical protein OSB04_019659 [Centaurea solstitialis]